MVNHDSNSLISENLSFENEEAMIKYVASFLLDFEENSIVDEEVINAYANSLLVDCEEDPHKQGLAMVEMENHVSNLTTSDQPFSTSIEEMKFVTSFFMDFDKNPEAQVNQDDNSSTPTPTPTSWSFEPNIIECSSNRESSTSGTSSPTYGSRVI